MVVDGFFRLWSRGHIRSHRRTRLDQLAFPVELQAVAPQPAGATGATLGLGELATLPKSSGGFSCSRKTTEFPVLLDGGAHPVDLGVPGDGLVVGIDHDHLEVLVGGILTHPIRVQHTETLESTADTLLCNGLEVPLWLLFFDGTRGLGLAVWASLGNRPLTSSTTHSNTVDDEALLVLVSQPPGLVWPG